ncbi:MAG: CBS domain-containing protein [Bacteriovorax sp.]|nr:CBS domain-containing protein [Bacteriovorax sp.]
MSQVSEVMKTHLEFCNPETRVPDLKYIIKKYDYDEVVIEDSDRHPLGIVNGEAVSDEALKNKLHPFDVRAGNLMTRISVNVRKDASIEECLKLMDSNQITVMPVVDEQGHCLGVVKKKDLISELRH